MREHKERMPFSSSLVLFQVRREECLSFHLRRTCLSLQLVVCFCSVVHRTVYTSARAFSRDARIAFTCGLTCGSNSRLCRPHKNKIITMSPMFAPAHFSYHHVTHVCTRAFLLLSLHTFNTHIFFLDPFIKNNLSGHVADQ